MSGVYANANVSKANISLNKLHMKLIKFCVHKSERANYNLMCVCVPKVGFTIRGNVG